jgi:ubiquinone/menaquinone biosynthesis C-methylase UbiE
VPEALGSYDPRAEDPTMGVELGRLEAQAAVSWDKELAVLRSLGMRDATRVLEVGAGPGAITERLRRALPSAAIVALEPEPALRSVADERLRGHGVELIAGDATAIPLPDASVDFALARLVFQHLPDPVSAAREIRRVLVPGGRLAVVDVDGELWGVAQPRYPALEAIHAKAWASLASRGGDRMIGRRLWRILRDAGFGDLSLQPFAYHSDELGLDAFAAVMDPARLRPLVETGVIGLEEYGRAVGGYLRFREDPDAFVLMVGLVAAGSA